MADISEVKIVVTADTDAAIEALKAAKEAFDQAQLAAERFMATFQKISMTFENQLQ